MLENSVLPNYCRFLDSCVNIENKYQSQLQRESYEIDLERKTIIFCKSIQICKGVVLR